MSSTCWHTHEHMNTHTITYTRITSHTSHTHHTTDTCINTEHSFNKRNCKNHTQTRHTDNQQRQIRNLLYKTQWKGSNISQSGNLFSNRRWTNQPPWRRSRPGNIHFDTAASNSRRKSPLENLHGVLVRRSCQRVPTLIVVFQTCSSVQQSSSVSSLCTLQSCTLRIYLWSCTAPDNASPHWLESLSPHQNAHTRLHLQSNSHMYLTW